MVYFYGDHSLVSQKKRTTTTNDQPTHLYFIGTVLVYGTVHTAVPIKYSFVH